MTATITMRAIKTPDAAAACSLVISVSPILKAVEVPHLSPLDTTLPSKSFLVSGSSESSTGATKSISLASASGPSGVISAFGSTNYAILLTSDQVLSSAGVGLVVKWVTLN